MKYIIYINEGREFAGPYGKKESAERRFSQLDKRTQKVSAVVPLQSDTEYFGKPIGNVTNH